MVIGPSQYVNFFSSYSCNATAQMLLRKSRICSGMQLQSNLAAFLFNYPFAVLLMIPDKPFPSQVSLHGRSESQCGEPRTGPLCPAGTQGTTGSCSATQLLPPQQVGSVAI